MGGLLGGGGAKGMLAPLSNYWGGLAPPGPPSSYAYVDNEHLVYANMTVSQWKTNLQAIGHDPYLTCSHSSFSIMEILKYCSFRSITVFVLTFYSVHVIVELKWLEHFWDLKNCSRKGKFKPVKADYRARLRSIRW